MAISILARCIFYSLIRTPIKIFYVTFFLQVTQLLYINLHFTTHLITSLDNFEKFGLGCKKSIQQKSKQKIAVRENKHTAKNKQTMNKKAFNKKEYCKKEAKVKSFSDLTRTGAFSVIRQLKLYLIASFD